MYNYIQCNLSLLILVFTLTLIRRVWFAVEKRLLAV